MRAVWKFALPIEDQVAIVMPVGAEVLCVGEQGDLAWLWGLVDQSADVEEHWFCVRGTGHPMTGQEGAYVGTVFLQGGGLVFHVFEAAS